MAGGGTETVDLNLMPFIDIFSLLTTFLLFSAVFVHIGILEVQVPFLTNAPPPPTKSSRSISVKVDLGEKNIEVITEYSEPPVDQRKYNFEHTDTGVASMHKKLIEIRQSTPENDKLTFFVDDEVTYEKMTRVLDEIKFVSQGEPQFKEIADDSGEEDDPAAKQKLSGDGQNGLYPKVVMGSVLL